LESNAIIVLVSFLKEIGGGSFIQSRRVGKCGRCNFKRTWDENHGTQAEFERKRAELATQLMTCELQIGLKRAIEPRGGRAFFIKWSHHHAPHPLLHANRPQIAR
jgi:hypothetical protein